MTATRPGNVEIPDLEAFAERARVFLDTHSAPVPPPRDRVWGVGSDRVGILPERPDRGAELQALAEAKRWKAAEFDAGMGWIDGPVRFGGAGLPTEYERAYRALRSGYAHPDLSMFGIGLGMVAPTIEQFGTDALRHRYLRALHRGDLVACQLFSEPAAGSDLASLRTRAVRDGSAWVLDGQKVWTTGGHLSDLGLALARTDPTATRRHGISAFLVDMHAPGVEVRPLRQMTGGASFNEVFFTAVRLPSGHLVGRESEGWTVARATLGHERNVAGNSGTDLESTLDQLTMLVRHSDRVADPDIRRRWADCYGRMLVRTLTAERAAAERGPGTAAGPEMSMGKLTWTEALRRCSALAAEVLGPALTADTGEWGTYAWSEFVLTVPGIRVSAGTDEIMRTILAERVLGLPRDPTT